MAEQESKYRFLFIQPFQLPNDCRYADKYHSAVLSKEQCLRMDYLNIRHLLQDIEWDFHGGPLAPYGDWAVETREEFYYVAAVITFGCSDAFWLQSFIQKRLSALGWEVPVLEGYSCAIALAKLYVDLGVDASGLAFPSDRPKQWRRKKLF